LSPMKEQDELAYKEETAYKEACRKLKNAKEQPTPPQNTRAGEIRQYHRSMFCIKM